MVSCKTKILKIGQLEHIFKFFCVQGTDSWRHYYISPMYDFIKIFIRSIWKAVFSLNNDWENCFRPYAFLQKQRMGI